MGRRGATDSGRLIGWAVRTSGLDDVAGRLGLTVRNGSRVTPSGEELRWRSAGSTRPSPNRACRSSSSGAKACGCPARRTLGRRRFPARARGKSRSSSRLAGRSFAADSSAQRSRRSGRGGSVDVRRRDRPVSGNDRDAWNVGAASPAGGTPGRRRALRRVARLRSHRPGRRGELFGLSIVQAVFGLLTSLILIVTGHQYRKHLGDG